MVWRGIEDARALGYACSLAHGLLMGSLWHSELARCHSFCLRMPAGNPISVVVPKKLVAAEPPIDPTGQPQHNYWTKNGMPYSTKTAMSAAVRRRVLRCVQSVRFGPQACFGRIRAWGWQRTHLGERGPKAASS